MTDLLCLSVSAFWQFGSSATFWIWILLLSADILTIGSLWIE